MNLADRWRRLEAALSSAESDSVTLCPGASEVRFPRFTEANTDLAILYSCHDGQSGSPLLQVGDQAFEFLTSKLAMKEYELMNELLDGGDFVGMRANPSTGIQNAWWHKHWMPIGRDSHGNLVCVDYVPAEGGTLAQVIVVNSDRADRQVVAESLGECLKLVADEWTDKTSG